MATRTANYMQDQLAEQEKKLTVPREELTVLL